MVRLRDGARTTQACKVQTVSCMNLGFFGAACGNGRRRYLKWLLAQSRIVENKRKENDVKRTWRACDKLLLRFDYNRSPNKRNVCTVHALTAPQDVTAWQVRPENLLTVFVVEYRSISSEFTQPRCAEFFRKKKKKKKKRCAEFYYGIISYKKYAD